MANYWSVCSSVWEVGYFGVVAIEDVGLFGWRWDALAIAGEDGFVGVGCVCIFVVKGLYSTPDLCWVGAEVYFV